MPACACLRTALFLFYAQDEFEALKSLPEGVRGGVTKLVGRDRPDVFGLSCVHAKHACMRLGVPMYACM